jgi:tetratricopeptide (TPR) repeat protein
MKKKILLQLLSILFISLANGQIPFAHEDTIRLIKFSPDNNFLVTSGDDKMVRVWNVNNGNLVRAFRHGYAINKIFVSTNGRYMLSGENDHSNCLWNLQTGKALRCLPDPDIAGFTPDEKNIVSIEYGNDGKRYARISLMSLENFQKKTFPHKIYTDSTIGAVHFLQGGKKFMIMHGKNMLIYDVDNAVAKSKHKLKHDNELIAISSNQKYYIHQGGKYISEMDGKKSVELQETLKEGLKSSIWFTNRDKNLVSIFNNEILVFETDSGRVIKKMYVKDYKYEISDDLKYIASSEDGKKLTLKYLNTEEAIHHFVAEDLDAKFGYQNYLLGIKSYREENYKFAITYFNKALGKVNDDKILLFRGRAYSKNGRYEKAIDDFLAYDSIYTNAASYDLARAYAGKGDATKAIIFLNKNFNSPYKERWSQIVQDKYFALLKNNPEWQKYSNEQILSEAEKFALSAEESSKRDNGREALKMLNESIRLEPNNATWYNMRAKVNLDLGKFEDAVNDYRREFALDSLRRNEVYRNIALAYTKKGDLAKASLLLNEIVKEDSSQFYLLLDVAEIELTRRNTTKALEAVNTYLSMLPEDDEAYYLRANILEGKSSKADIEKAIHLSKLHNKPVPKKYVELLNSLK